MKTPGNSKHRVPPSRWLSSEIDLADEDLKEVVEVTTSPPGVFRRGETVEHEVVITVNEDTSIEVNGLLNVDRALGNQGGEGVIRLAGRCVPPPEDVICPDDLVTVEQGESRAFTIRVITDDAAEGVYTGNVPLSWSAGGTAEGAHGCRRGLPHPCLDVQPRVHTGIGAQSSNPPRRPAHSQWGR